MNPDSSSFEEPVQERPRAQAGPQAKEPGTGAIQHEDESGELLPELRSAWLADFEAAASRPVPAPPTFAQKLRRGLKIIGEEFAFCFERMRRGASVGGSSTRRGRARVGGKARR